MTNSFVKLIMKSDIKMIRDLINFDQI